MKSSRSLKSSTNQSDHARSRTAEINLSRRGFLLGTGTAAANSLQAAPGSGTVNVADVLRINDLDQRIWHDEIDEFLPARVYDMHCHLTRAEFNLDASERAAMHPLRRVGSLEILDAVEALLFPNRSVTHILIPSCHPKCDFDGQNTFIAAEARKRPGTPALMLVHPQMSAEDADLNVKRHRFVGFKCYRWYSVTGDVNECRITDFLPEHLIAVADRYGLMIILHIARKLAIADPYNLADLEHLTAKYPRVRWILAHCARSYSAWAMETAGARLKHIPNLWVDTSSVCETDAFLALFSTIDLGRICYGSDDLPVGITRGKYITYGHSWGEMNERNQQLKKDYCDGRMTFVRYEMLRAMRRAASQIRLTKPQIEAIFYHNGARLIEAVKQDLFKAFA